MQPTGTNGCKNRLEHDDWILIPSIMAGEGLYNGIKPKEQVRVFLPEKNSCPGRYTAGKTPNMFHQAPKSS